jgi:hypothetical protein
VSRPIRVGESAAAEFAEAVRWHEGRRRGLGSELHELVITALGLIADHPELGLRSEGRRIPS